MFMVHVMWMSTSHAPLSKWHRFPTYRAYPAKPPTPYRRTISGLSVMPSIASGGGVYAEKWSRRWRIVGRLVMIVVFLCGGFRFWAVF